MLQKREASRLGVLFNLPSGISSLAEFEGGSKHNCDYSITDDNSGTAASVNDTLDDLYLRSVKAAYSTALMRQSVNGGSLTTRNKKKSLTY